MTQEIYRDWRSRLTPMVLVELGYAIATELLTLTRAHRDQYATLVNGD